MRAIFKRKDIRPGGGSSGEAGKARSLVGGGARRAVSIQGS